VKLKVLKLSDYLLNSSTVSLVVDISGG